MQHLLAVLASTGGDPQLLAIVVVVLAGSALAAVLIGLDALGVRVRSRRRRNATPATGRAAAEREMAAAFPQTAPAVRAPASRREVTVGGRA